MEPGNRKKAEDGRSRATALVSMTKDEKKRLTHMAREHGMALSAFLRLAAEEYIRNHKWQAPTENKEDLHNEGYSKETGQGAAEEASHAA